MASNFAGNLVGESTCVNPELTYLEFGFLRRPGKVPARKEICDPPEEFSLQSMILYSDKIIMVQRLEM
jgi:hypothetical protein